MESWGGGEVVEDNFVSSLMFYAIPRFILSS